MRFEKDDGTFFELKVSSSKPDQLINFELVPKSDRSFYSVDRGYKSDRYSTTLTFFQPREYINDLLTELQLLRDSGKNVVISQIDEPIFTDNINWHTDLKCMVKKVSPQGGSTLHVDSVDIELLLIDPPIHGGSFLPSRLDCVSSNYKTYSIWNTSINESYFRSNFLVDREADAYEFEGHYTLSLDDNISTLGFWKAQRGDPFVIQDGDWGVDYMFGPDGGNGSHEVIITGIDYDKASPFYRQTTIKLVKVG